MANNYDDVLLKWLNENLPLDNNEITDEEIFLEFIDGFIDQLVYQTNLYSIRRGRPLNVKNFLLKFLTL